MVRTLELRATQDGMIWPSRPLISARGLLSSIKNLPLTSYDKAQLTRFRDVTFNSTGELLAATDEKGRIFVFFIASNRYALVQHLGVPTIACCFSPLRKTELLVTCENETARCIDVQSQVLVSTLRGHRYPARSASFQKSGKLALTASQDAVILWDTHDWSRFRVLNAGPGVEAATFVARGDLIAVCFQDDTIMMWALESLALQYRFALPEHEHPAGLRSITVSDDHRVLVASGRSPFIYVWDFEAQTIIRIIELPAPIKEVVTHTFLPGHISTISILEGGGALYFLDVAADRPRIQLEIAKRDKTITAFDIECHARYLAACSNDGYLLLYDLEIARETARRARAERRKEGLFELEDNARLATRSGLRSADGVADASHPVASKLIDSLFGATTAPRRSEHMHIAGNGDKEPSTVEPHHSEQPSGRRRGHVLDGSPIHHTRHVVATPATSAARTRVNNPLRATAVGAAAPPSAREIEVNRKRLEASLRCNGAYPRKYRLLVWRFLLRLPKNDEAFRSLVRKGRHAAFVRLEAQYPLQNQRLFRRLLRVLSAIAWWCPAFGEVSYLPEVVYPFVKLFRENDLAAFEASVSVLLHWCGGFLRSLPSAPTAVLTALDRELQRRDPQLHAHFAQHQVGAEVYGWALLKTIFTEVLSEHEWLALWDHLLTFSSTPELLSVAVLAYLAYFRSALLGACDRASIDQFFHQQNALQLASFLQLLMNLGESVDLAAFRSQDATGTADGTAPTKSLWPLPRGQYPAFSSYPKFVVDFQINERNRIALEESELVRKQQLLADIEQQCAKLQAEHDAWLEQKRMVLAAEETRRSEALAAEKARILSLKSLDQQTRQRRLERLDAMEKHAHESLAETAKAFAAESERLEATLSMQRERTAFELASRQQDEALARVEFETEKRVRAVHKQREMEQRLQTLRAEFAARVQQHELADLIKFESWRREDDARTRAVEMQLQRREELAVLQQEAAMRQQLEAELLAQVVEKERELAALETERTARQHEQCAFDALDHEIEMRRAELEVLKEPRGDECDARTATGADAEEFVGAEPLGSVFRDGRVHDREGRDTRTSTRVPSNGRRAQFSDPTPRDSRDADSVPDRTQRSHGQRSTDVGGGDARTNTSTMMPTSATLGHRQTWATPATGASHTQQQQQQQSESRRASAPATHASATQLSEQRAALDRSLLHSASSEGSFTSAVLERTMEEMTLLERALRTVSSSSSSSSSSSVHIGSSGQRPSRMTPVQPTQRERQHSSVSFADDIGRGDVTRSDRARSAAARHGASGMRAHRPSAGDGDDVDDVDKGESGSVNDSVENRSDTSRASSSAAVQRPIAELEKELGIRFDDFSDDGEDEEQKDGESESEDDDCVSDGGVIEDDRARLLARAKKLLEAEEFSSDDDEDEP